MSFIIRVAITTLLIILSTELARTHRFIAAMLVSLPVSCIITFIWLYLTQKDVGNITDMSIEVFWLVLLSLPFYIFFPLLLKHQMNFWLALVISCVTLLALFLVVMLVKSKFS